LARWIREQLAGAGQLNPCGDDDVVEMVGKMVASEQKKTPQAWTWKDEKEPEEITDKMQLVRDIVSRKLRLFQKELVGRKRSLRFLDTAKTMQDDPKTFSSGVCDKCKKGKMKLSILSCCGHTACAGCLNGLSLQQCPQSGCDAAMRDTDILPLATIQRSAGSDCAGFGAKLDNLVELLKRKVIKARERAIIFTQYPELEEQVAKALKAAKIASLQLKGTAHQKSGAVEKFQQASSDAQVLLLNVGDESASGMNLTMANHVVFVHPVLSSTQEQYCQWETQAIGRIRRYGQQKTCLIHRLVAENTIDQRILEKRSCASPAK
jgi:SNF2 family DNA or RNA helicase